MNNSTILYKYISAEGFKRFWDSEKIRFTQLNQLNDPYENRILPEKFDYNSDGLEGILGDEYKDLKGYYETEEKKIIKKHFENLQKEIDNRWGILSLTNNPINFLMWSHYADQHKGVVIGIDMQHEVFKHDEKNIVNVRYSALKKTFPIAPKRQLHENGKQHTLIIGDPPIPFIYMHKSIEWAYEEEVRVVRDLHSEIWIKDVVTDKNGNSIFLYPLPKQAIKFLIFGERFDESEFKKIANESVALNHEIAFHKVFIDNLEYRLNTQRYVPD